MIEDKFGEIDFLKSVEAELSDQYQGVAPDSREGIDTLATWVVVRRKIAMLETGEVPPSLLTSHLVPALVDRSVQRLYRGGWRSMVRRDSTKGENI